MADAPHTWERIKALFAQAMELPPGQRPAFLDRECFDTPDLRREVESLLAARTIGAVRTAGAAAALDETGGGRSTASAPITEGPGTRIGPYKLLQLIGEGGFGSVFMAEQEHPVRRRVALKIIKLGMDTRAVIARFEAERQALAMMDHPNIARVLDAGATDTGRPYFVMELVKGVPITEYCDTAHLTARQRLELVVPVCHAVQHAHQKGVIHRDLKPSNILVTLHDGTPVPKVIDFGIAKATASRLTEKTLFTEHRQLIGTPAYMSPEQAEMSGLDIDTRADVYSLGVLLYELLTGTTPLSTADLASAGYAEIQRIIREVEPPKPSTRVSTLISAPSPSSRGAGVPPAVPSLASIAARRNVDPRRLSPLLRGDLDWIVMKALEKDRTRRYDTAVGLAEDIGRHLRGEPVVAAPPGAGYRVRKFIRRNRGKVAAGASVATTLLLGLGTSTWQWQRARQANSEVSAQASIARQALADLPRIMGSAENWSDIGKELQSTINEQGLGRISSETGDILGLAGAARMAANGAANKQRELEAANSKLQVEVRRARLAEATIKCEKSKFLDIGQGGREQACADLQDVVKTREELLGIDNLDTIKAIWLLGTNQIEPDADLPFYEDAATRLDRAGKHPDSELAYKYAGVVAHSRSVIDIDTAKKWLKRIADALPSIAQQEGADGFWSALSNFRDFGIEYFKIDQNAILTPDLAAAVATRLATVSDSLVLEDAAMLWTDDYPRAWATPVSVERDPDALQHRSEYAAQYWQKIADLARRLLTADAGDPHALTSLAAAQRVLGQSADALETARHAESARSKQGLAQNPVNAAIAAMALHDLGRQEEAKVELNRLRELMHGASTEVGYSSISHYSETAEALIDPKPTPAQQLAEETKNRRLAEANLIVQRSSLTDPWDPSPDVGELERAYQTRDELLGHNDPLTIGVLTLLGNARLSNDDLAGLPILREAVARLAAITPLPDGKLLSVWSRAALWHSINLEFEYAEELHAKIAASAEDVVRRTAPTVVAVDFPPSESGTFRRESSAEESFARRVVQEFGGAHGASFRTMLASKFAQDAIGHFKVGHVEHARAKLARLRSVIADPKNADTWAKDAKAKALIAEAEALIDPPPTPAPPPK